MRHEQTFRIQREWPAGPLPMGLWGKWSPFVRGTKCEYEVLDFQRVDF